MQIHLSVDAHCADGTQVGRNIQNFNTYVPLLMQDYLNGTQEKNPIKIGNMFQNFLNGRASTLYLILSDKDSDNSQSSIDHFLLKMYQAKAGNEKLPEVFILMLEIITNKAATYYHVRPDASLTLLNVTVNITPMTGGKNGEKYYIIWFQSDNVTESLPNYDREGYDE